MRNPKPALRRAAALLALAVFFAVSAPSLPRAADLLPHQAFYKLRLLRTIPGSTLTDVSGAMYLDWVDSCEGWSSSQRLELRFYDAEKPAVDIDSRFASWESHDGLSYRFSVESTRDNQADKQLNGKASLQAIGGPGKAEFLGAKPVKLDLPAGTLFPARHMIELIDRAQAGDKIVARTVFDGTSDDGAFLVNAVIGAQKSPKADEAILPKTVNLPYRPMRLAFFNPAKDQDTPFYELSVDLMNNGIARSFVLDYGDSVIGAELDRIKLLDKPKC